MTVIPQSPRTVVVGSSGGSGAPYGLRLIEVLLHSGLAVQWIVSDAGLRVLQYELGFAVRDPEFRLESVVPEELRERLCVFAIDAVESAPASGSAPIDAVVLCPCSMGTLARVAHGFSTNLIERAADVALKEQRTLVVVPRETPLSLVHLRNMVTLAEAGGVVLPAMPGFYHRPESIDELVDFVVARILDRIGVDHDLVRRWSTPEPKADVSVWDEGEVEP